MHQYLPKCGEPAPIIPHPFGSLSFNGKPIQLSSVTVHCRRNVRYVVFEVSSSDTTLPLGLAAMPGMLLGIAFHDDQAPGIMKIEYQQRSEYPNPAMEFLTGGVFLEAHGYLANAGKESILEVHITKNNKDRVEGTFTLKGQVHPKYNFPSCTIEGKFYSPAPIRLSGDAQ